MVHTAVWAFFLLWGCRLAALTRLTRRGGVVLVLLVGIGSSSLFNKNFTLVLKQRKKR